MKRSLPIFLLPLLVLAAHAKDEKADPLSPGADLAADGAIAATPKEKEKEVLVSIAKNVTVVLDLAAKFPVRLDRQVKRGTDPISLFKVGRRVCVLGRDHDETRPGSGLTPSYRIAPYHALVLGEGLEPKSVLPAARDKFGEKVRWFAGTVDHYEMPDVLWVKSDATIRALTIGRDDTLLTTTLYESAAFAAGELRRALAKGEAVRFRGKISTVLYTDAKGRLVEEADRKKSGVKAEVRLTPSRLILLDAAFPYPWVETAQE